MALAYSLGRKTASPHETELNEAIAAFERAGTVFLSLMADDQVAFETLSAIRKSPADEVGRSIALAQAVLTCIRVPQAVAVTAEAVLTLAVKTAAFGVVPLLSDLAVCGELCTATVRAAALNIRANLPDMPDVSERVQVAAEADRRVAHAVQLVQELMKAIAARTYER